MQRKNGPENGKDEGGPRDDAIEGEILVNTADVLERWKIYFDTHINRTSDVQEQEEPLTVNEVQQQLEEPTLKEAKGIVQIQQRTSEDFEIKHGLRQGGGLAPLLFNIALDKDVRATNVNVNGTILKKERQMGYTDDLDLIAKSKRALRERYEKVKQKSTNFGLEINVSKTKAMEIKTGARLGQNWTVDNDCIKVVQKFTYLGSNLNTNNDITQEIRNKTIRGNRALYLLRPILVRQIMEKT
ncbi:hypothetical protein ILUMI_02673 [Ignelater luminosus]|uniref:Reverse transcriptase domain-containing protein n=1 Tax=Ignelater luminosus TaxID=2038154 RepID=A0A8K0DG29_IGNLU|nr:hypothetical protein ILUMI_02673 [Ignelater luminosus]